MTGTGSKIAAAIGLAVAACASDPAVDEAPLASVGDLTVHDAYAPAPVTPDIGALYFTIRNAGAEPDRILSVQVDVADGASLHSQSASGGGMRMQQLQSIPVPARGAARLVPGGHHVMLTALKGGYVAGDTVQVEVLLERAGSVRFAVPVIEYAELDARFAGEGR